MSEEMKKYIKHLTNRIMEFSILPRELTMEEHKELKKLRKELKDLRKGKWR